MTPDIRTFDVLDSTNAQCRRIADGGHEGNIWVVAEQQTEGRGRRGREWVSGPGNLFASLLYGIDCDLATASQLSFVAALAVQDVIADILPSDLRVTCKWPNDILVGDKKISGILLETAGQGAESSSHVIIGIGINVIHHPDNPQYPATNLKDEGGTLELEMIMERLAEAMAHWTSLWKKQGFTPICQAWKDKAQGLGQDIIVRLPEEELQGRFVDLGDNGALILEFGGEKRHITAGDIFFT